MSTSSSASDPPWARYRIRRGETGALTFEPYKSALLPLWRFRTSELARKSSLDLWNAFLDYENEDDFVGMDMARKYLQMGMTRAKRYANHKGGRKYSQGGKGIGEVLDGDTDGWKGSEGWKEKDEASRVFKEVWEKARAFKGYQVKKAEFLKRQRGWEKQRKAELGKGSRKGHREI
ncbi:MAG: hypothetical protein Q9175_002769 [Cornicularia normoerica]